MNHDFERSFIELGVGEDEARRLSYELYMEIAERSGMDILSVVPDAGRYKASLTVFFRDIDGRKRAAKAFGAYADGLPRSPEQRTTTPPQGETLSPPQPPSLN